MWNLASCERNDQTYDDEYHAISWSIPDVLVLNIFDWLGAGFLGELAPQEEPDPEDELEEEEPTEPGPAPKLIVRTEPAELIVSEGKPEFQPIVGTDLLYVSNSETDILMDIDDQKYYVLLSGRWYESQSLSGPWTYVPGDQVPDAARFHRIDWVVSSLTV